MVNGGKAKYKITFEISTGETYVFYFNTLDNNYGKSNWYGTQYNRDWKFLYDNNLSLGHRVEIRGTAITSADSLYGTVSTTDTLNGQPTREFKVWELIYNRQLPFGSRFYARTTPFGVAPSYIDNGYGRTLILGTDIILDTVYNNLGSDDMYGYNTELGNGTTIPNYFMNPPIISGANDTGNTFCTPGRKFTDPFNYFIYGMKITIENGDSLTLKRGKKLWVTGTNTPFEKGDTLELKHGSTVILENNAEIFQCFGGQLLRDSLSTIVWNNQSCIRSFANSGASFTGGDHTVNNGGFMVIDGSATLTLGDNTTLTFDGATSFLKLDSNSNVKLGQNSKIVFKNGAYIRAKSAAFSWTSSGKISDGLVFENSGLDSIVNCTFSNAKASITIKNDSISSANANNNIIRRNTFNVSQAYGRGIDARNLLNLLLDSNTFDISSNDNTVGLYFRNSINASSIGGASAPASSYSLNITNNTTLGGHLPFYLSCLAADKTPMYLYRNEFYGDNVCSVACLKISGKIKENIFDVWNSYSSIGLWSSSPAIYRNTIQSNSHNMYLNNSFPMLSSVRDGDELIWIGGSNYFSSAIYENLLVNDSRPVLEYGKNIFEISNSSPFHILGSLTDTNLYGMRYNCWYGHYDSAKFKLYKYNSGYPETNFSSLYPRILQSQFFTSFRESDYHKLRKWNL